jgi:hypothetical protein
MSASEGEVLGPPREASAVRAALFKNGRMAYISKWLNTLAVTL